MYSDISKSHIYENLKIGYEFEFFSPLSRKVLAEKLSMALGKRVHALETHDAGFPIDEMNFKIEPDFSGGMKMHEFVTGPLPYYEAIHVLYKAYNFIDENAYTTERCGAHINVSINEKALGLRTAMSQMNVFKFVIGLDEKKIFEIWPTLQTSKVQKVYKHPVTYIHPKNRFISEKMNTVTMMNSADFSIPQSKYYGVNFEKLKEGYLEIRYAGGQGYQKKKNQSTALINLIGEHIFNVLSNNKSYSQEEIDKCNDIIVRNRKISIATRTFEALQRNYPRIEFIADMSDHRELLRNRYMEIREKVSDLLNFTGMTYGVINYDSDRKRLQVRDAKIKSDVQLEGYDFFNCKIESEMKDCLVYECKITSSLMKECTIAENNEIKYGFLDHCKYSASGLNTIKYSYLKNDVIAPIAGKMVECIINKGVLLETSEVDSKTEIIQVEKGTSKIDHV